MAEVVRNVYCPMMKKVIETGYCEELQMIADDEVYPTDEEDYLTNEDFKICNDCKKRIDPAL